MITRKLLITTAVLIAGITAASAQQKLLIGSTSSSSSQYGYFVAVSQIINAKVQGIESSVVETGATVDNLRRLDRKQIDLGLVTTNTGYQAYAGTEGFKDKPVPVRLLWVYTAAPQNVIVRKDANIAKIADLAGKKFNPGLRGSATEKTTEAVFKLLGIKVDEARGSTSDIVDAIKDNRVVGYVKSGAGTKLDGSSLDIATFTPIQVLSLTDEQADKIKKEMPDLGVVKVAAGAADGVPAYTTWSFGLAVVARADMPEDVAYKIVKAIDEDKSVQANALAEMKGANIAQMTVDYGSIPLHAGAAKYLKEKGLEIPARIAPK
ncbi:MAG: TAXI family TRAP transporter solute-binding subunit [Pseudolabrys sp.]|nr:TAXI family TRAP transporter solute-binding subunit [Pseudolabrys sp.]